MLETSGLIGNWSTLSFDLSLCILVVPWNSSGQKPVWYKGLYWSHEIDKGKDPKSSTKNKTLMMQEYHRLYPTGFWGILWHC